MERKQENVAERLAVWLLDHRLAFLVCVGLVTLFFAYYALQLKMETSFGDLLPQNHEYVKVYNEIRDVFGGANIILAAVTVRSGDIYKPEVLRKIKEITEQIDIVPGVNHNQVISIAHRKVKDVKAQAGSIATVPVMWPNLPRDSREIEELKKTIHTNDTIYGPLVSLSDQSALISAALSEGAVDYRKVFERIRTISERAEDENVSVQVIGEPILYGWVYHYVPQTYIIFGVTVAFIVVLQYLYFGGMMGALRPFISGTVSAIWGLGFMRLMGFAFDPLIAVIPFLMTARAVSHSVQMMERYFEEYEAHQDVRKGCIATFAGLCAPTLLGIVTDALGILIVVVSPMPILQKLGVFGAFWVMSIVVSELILNLLIFSYLPPPREVSAGRRGRSVLKEWLAGIARCTFGGLQWVTAAAFLGILGVGALYASRLTVGDVSPGSPILWPESLYNRDAEKVNALYPGSDQLMIVARGDERDRIKDPTVLRRLEAFQIYLEDDPNCGGTQSIADLVRYINMVLHENDPKWHVTPDDKLVAGNMITLVRDSSDPGDLDRFVDYQFKDASIVAYYKDHRGKTIQKAIARAKEFIAANKVEGVHFELAGGLIGVLAAANEEIAGSQILSIALALLTIFAACAITYRSFVAGLLFVVPLALSNVLTFAYMAWKGIGLNVNTLPVAALGIGLGVDYGIYVVSRMIEEAKKTGDVEEAIERAITTSGRAVLLTATTMGGGVIFWYFLSDLRFEGEMGLLLAVWMVISMLGGTILLPTLINILRPRFVSKAMAEGGGELCGSTMQRVAKGE